MRLILLLFFLLLVTVELKAQDNLFGRNWKQGYYYNSEGKRLNGYIDSSTLYNNSGHIIFKISKDGSKTKIPFASLKSVVIGVDSFTFSLKHKYVLIVVLDRPLKLYSMIECYFCGTNVGTYGPNYYYGVDPDNITLVRPKNFIPIMSEIMSDKPEVVKKIQDKTFDCSFMDLLIEYYKTEK